MPENYKVIRFNPFSRSWGSSTKGSSDPAVGGDVKYSGKEGTYDLAQQDVTPGSPPPELPYRSHISHAGNTNSWDTRIGEEEESTHKKTPWQRLAKSGW
jgi:hypothetical protein